MLDGTLLGEVDGFRRMLHADEAAGVAGLVVVGPYAGGEPVVAIDPGAPAQALALIAGDGHRLARARIDEAKARGENWPSDPDGAPLYPTGERGLTDAERLERISSGLPYAWRLDMERALAAAGEPLTWRESGAGPAGQTGLIAADPSRWGDVVIARKDTPTSYHLSVVVDDALQGVTHVVRGRDLFHATAVHRLLQKLLGLPEPLYHHHDLLLGEDGLKLSKSRRDTALAALRERGWTPHDIRTRLGF